MTAAEAHPPTQVLAELAGDALDSRQSREIQAHVDQCALCQETLGRLTRVTATLREAPADVPMPEFVAARIGAALAAEHASRSEPADGARGSGDGDPADGEGGTVAWFRRKLPASLAAAASVSVLGLAGYVALTSGGGDSGGDDSGGAEVAAGAAADSASETSEGALSGQGRALPQEEDQPDMEAGPSTVYGQPEELASPLASAVVEIWESRDQVVEGCGQTLADELGLELVGSRNEGSGVLVVLDAGDGVLAGWQVPTCGDDSSQRITEPVEVPVQE
ncbi:hypothetical protein [Jiangella gansuensis]|uniref:hypothetical protein n=1 Tax=Jiangella gansuensis TaxID=281473 RepID=UPI00047DE7C0|nr:hypothetical protein [Jiangella gansuensis]